MAFDRGILYLKPSTKRNHEEMLEYLSSARILLRFLHKNPIVTSKEQTKTTKSVRQITENTKCIARGHYKHVIQHSNTTCNYTYSVSFECDPTISLRFRFWPFNFFLKSFFTRRCFLCCLFFLSFAILKMNERNTGY